MNVAIFEFLCGSGTLQDSPLLDEGHAMLHALAEDLIQHGVSVHSVLETSIAHRGLWNRWSSPQWNWSPISYSPSRSVDEVATDWMACSRDMDAVIVIAPELDGTLERIVSVLRSAGIPVLSGDEPFLRSSCDQWLTCQAWQSAGVRHPATWLLADFLNHPLRTPGERAWVLKRRDSAGGVGQRRFRDVHELLAQVSKTPEIASQPERWIVQAWVPGLPASLAMLIQEERSLLGCFEQRFESTHENGEPHWGYTGGVGPIEGVRVEELERFACLALDALPGQPRGWIGIDLVIEPDGRWSAIEVNPRLTTSYLGYRQWYGSELAKSWLLGRSLRLDWKEFPPVSFSVGAFER